MSGWLTVAYACEGCGATYTTMVYGGPSREELGEGRNHRGEQVHAAACVKCGGRFRLIEEDR